MMQVTPIIECTVDCSGTQINASHSKQDHYRSSAHNYVSMLIFQVDGAIQDIKIPLYAID